MTDVHAAIVALLLAVGCASNEELAARLQGAMTPAHLAPVAACWESAFEESGFRAEYLAILNLTVTPDGVIDEVTVRGIYDTTKDAEKAAPEAAALGRCVESGLEGADLGEGLAGGTTLKVRGFRLALRDGSASARAEASARAANVLIGPRSDRCKGLYTYDPPREAGVVQSELVAAEARIERAEDRDALARALQETYDLALELERRLAHEGDRDDLPPASRARIGDEQERAERLARQIAPRIGCR